MKRIISGIVAGAAVVAICSTMTPSAQACPFGNENKLAPGFSESQPTGGGTWRVAADDNGEFPKKQNAPSKAEMTLYKVATESGSSSAKGTAKCSPPQTAFILYVDKLPHPGDLRRVDPADLTKLVYSPKKHEPPVIKAAVLAQPSSGPAPKGLGQSNQSTKAYEIPKFRGVSAVAAKPVSTSNQTIRAGIPQPEPIPRTVNVPQMRAGSFRR